MRDFIFGVSVMLFQAILTHRNKHNTCMFLHFLNNMPHLKYIRVYVTLINIKPNTFSSLSSLLHQYGCRLNTDLLYKRQIDHCIRKWNKPEIGLQPITDDDNPSSLNLKLFTFHKSKNVPTFGYITPQEIYYTYDSCWYNTISLKLTYLNLSFSIYNEVLIYKL